MPREKIEKLGSLFTAVFSTGLALQLATVGMEPRQWLGAALAVSGSLALAFAVRAWPNPAEAPIRARRGRED
jgi:hypothetical protein